jgi:hypothetical protein
MDANARAGRASPLIPSSLARFELRPGKENAYCSAPSSLPRRGGFQIRISCFFNFDINMDVIAFQAAILSESFFYLK